MVSDGVGKREKFISAQTASMLSIILVLVLFNALSLSLYVIFSYIAFGLLSWGMRMTELPYQPRRRLYLLLLFGGVLSVAVVVYQALLAMGVI